MEAGHVLKRILLITALFLLALPASAHTDTELSDWRAGWEQKLENRGLLDSHLVDEWLSMHERHPCRAILGTWTEACEPAPEPHREAAVAQKRSSSVSRGMGGNVEQWRGLVASYFGTHTDAALRVIACESQGVATAYNPSGASGLFQLMPVWHRHYGGDPFNPADNVRMAYSLFRDTGGWSHWVCKP